MNTFQRLFVYVIFAVILTVVGIVAAHAAATLHIPDGPALATIDLATREGVELVKGQWRYSDTQIIETTHRKPDTNGQPTGEVIKTWDYIPHAGAADFDDANWQVLDPTTLQQRRGFGRLSFNWYRIKLTIPRRIGSFDPSGTTAVFETALDDYAEVWVDGELPRMLGQSGGSVVKGWNSPNRLIVGRNLQPGQQIQVAVFGMNGPVSDPPANFIWMRYARLEFYKSETSEPIAIEPHEVNLQVITVDPALNEIVPANPKLYKLAEGFKFTEGPVWVGNSYLLFSDPNSNRIYKYDPNDSTLSVYKEPSGYSGDDIAEYGQPGSNGLTLDRQGRLTINEHGNHRVTRIEKTGAQTVLANHYQGKRLNSPNDLVYKSDGALYFTDPPFGLPKFFDDPRKELPYSGVFRWQAGKLSLLSADLVGPNGLAFSPDEKYLYVGNWDPQKKIIIRYHVNNDGSLTNGKVFFDMTSAPGEDALDGVKVDQRGNLYVSGPGGLWIISEQGKHLGTIVMPKHPHNFAWGDADGKTLYLAARSTLYRMQLNIPGIRP